MIEVPEVAQFVDIGIRLIVAILLGSVLGFERTYAQKVAGPRTYAMVALGSALFVTIGIIAAHAYLAAGVTTFDLMRIPSQVVVGIGFLGAGLIIFRDNQVENVTTASGIWVAAGIGLACGFGMLWLALIATVLSFLIFTGLWYIEQHLKQNWYDTDVSR